MPKGEPRSKRRRQAERNLRPPVRRPSADGPSGPTAATRSPGERTPTLVAPGRTRWTNATHTRAAFEDPRNGSRPPATGSSPAVGSHRPLRV